METSKETRHATCQKVILVTPDRLREIANEMERASKSMANKGETTMVTLTETIVLAYDPIDTKSI